MMTTRQRSAKPASQTAGERERLPAELTQINLNAAGIDVGASSHYVAVSAVTARSRRCASSPPSRRTCIAWPIG